jgi:hypothetical protein
VPEDLETQLDAWEARVRDLDDDAFVPAWASVTREMVALARSPGVEVLESEAGQRFHGRLAPYQRRHLALSERAEAQELLAAPPPTDGTVRALLATTFGRQTFDRLEETLRLVDFGAPCQVVVVGCGAFPAAALFFGERLADATIRALDVDRTAAGLAARVADKHGSDRLSVRCEDGRTHDYDGASAVYVVNQVTPKGPVLERIAATARPGTRVVVRDPFGPGRLLADSVDRSLPSPWRLAATGAVDPNFFSRHLVLVRD